MQKIKEQNEDIIKEYGFCIIDGHKERIGNFKIEPPGLFRGRGEHPKMGMLKRRVLPEDVIINCSKDSKIPKPPDGHKWKEVRHDKNVSVLNIEHLLVLNVRFYGFCSRTLQPSKHVTRVNRIKLSGSHFPLQLCSVVSVGLLFLSLHNIPLNKSD